MHLCSFQMSFLLFPGPKKCCSSRHELFLETAAAVDHVATTSEGSQQMRSSWGHPNWRQKWGKNNWQEITSKDGKTTKMIRKHFKVDQKMVKKNVMCQHFCWPISLNTIDSRWRNATGWYWNLIISCRLWSWVPHRFNPSVLHFNQPQTAAALTAPCHHIAGLLRHGHGRGEMNWSRETSRLQVSNGEASARDQRWNLD